MALCALLLRQPDLLLLDEPTNHLDGRGVSGSEQYLEKSIPGTVVMTIPDRYFLDNVARWILEMTAAGPIPPPG